MAGEVSGGSGKTISGAAVAGNAGSPHAAQAAGSIVTVSGSPWQIINIHGKLVNSAFVGNRLPQFLIKDASGNVVTLAAFSGASGWTAGVTYYLDAYNGAGQLQLTSGGSITRADRAGLAAMIIPAGYTIEEYDSAVIAPGYYAGTASASDATTMTVAGTPWQVNAFAGYVVTMGGSTGNVASNTNHILTIDAWSPLAPATGAFTLVGSGDTIELSVSYTQ